MRTVIKVENNLLEILKFLEAKGYKWSSLEEFKNKIDMKRSNILPGYKLVLENGNVFVVMDYKNTKIVFPEGSSRTVISLDNLCNEDLSPNPGVSRIMKVLNALNLPIWERKFTRNEIEAGFTMTNEDGNNYLIVQKDSNLRIVNTRYFIVGSKLTDVMNEDMSPSNSSYAAIVEIKNREGKIVYSKK